MFPLMLFSTLFSSTLPEPGEHWICNSSDVSLWYSYCDNMKYPISIRSEPCVELKGSKGYLHIFYIPRRDIKNLYFNLYLSFNTVDFPMRKEVICRGSDDDYSFCRALKGETVNTTVPFSYRGILFSKHHLQPEADITRQLLTTLRLLPPVYIPDRWCAVGREDDFQKVSQTSLPPTSQHTLDTPAKLDYSFFLKHPILLTSLSLLMLSVY